MSQQRGGQPVLILREDTKRSRGEEARSSNFAAAKAVAPFLDEEAQMVRSMVNKVVSSGANVLLCQKGIDDAAQHFRLRVFAHPSHRTPVTSG